MFTLFLSSLFFVAEYSDSFDYYFFMVELMFIWYIIFFQELFLISEINDRL